VCHGPDPSGLTSRNGPFNTTSYRGSTGTVFYPTDAEPPFSAIAICPGFTNTGPEMEPWGPFYASHGFVMVAVRTSGADQPATRATKLLAGVEELERANTDSGSQLFGKLSGRYGTSGYSMGGGGTTIASGRDATLKTSIGLAAWGPQTSGVQVPTLLLCGSSDGTAPCSTSQRAYGSLPSSTPKMMVSISGATHFSWFSPTSAGRGTSGEAALAFQKVFLDGDERWRPLLLQTGGTVTTNIQ
jgi:pimeloyl-ACP methyl ester carboxylesterase